MSDEVRVMGAGELLVSGVAIEWFATLAERAVAGYRLNGMRNALFEAWARDAAEGVARRHAAPTAAIGSPAVPIAAVSASSSLVDPVGATEAAEMSGCKVRNITDLCSREVFTTARKVGGQWQIERAEVLARMEGMAS